MKFTIKILFLLLCIAAQPAMAQDSTAVLTAQVNLNIDSIAGEQDVTLSIQLLDPEIMCLIIKVGTAENTAEILNEEVNFEFVELVSIQAFEHNGNSINVGLGTHPLNTLYVEIIARKTNGTLANPVTVQ
jgi:hypothetical protein